MSPGLRGAILTAMARILVVANDEAVASPLTAALVAEGHEVVRCGGPRGPEFLCAAAGSDRCAFTHAIDGIVVDGWLESDVERRGLPSWHLIAYYRGIGIPVVALIGPDGLPGPVTDAGVRALPRSSGVEAIVEATALFGSRLSA